MTRQIMILGVIIGVCACASVEKAPSFRGSYLRGAMGTVARIVVNAPDEASAVRAAEEGFALIERIEQALSDYRATSEVAELGRNAGGAAIPVSEVLMSVLTSSIREASRSDGAFDPTVGPLVKLWREARASKSMPDQGIRDAAQNLVNFRYIELDPVRSTARLRRPGMRLDFGGIGKGFAADRVVAHLRSLGFPSSMCELGGDFALGDPPPYAEGWRIGAGDGGPALVLSNCGVATSGDVEQHVVIDGIRYSHIVNPRTGLGLTTRARVTVVAHDGTTADALATALSVLGHESGFPILPQGAHARISYAMAEPLVYMTPNYQKLSASR